VKLESLKQNQFARCPRCQSVVKIEPGSTHTNCIKCGVKIKVK
jgi:uncharacterized C2H2 Zn-finger protein